MEVNMVKKRKNRRNKIPEQSRNYFCGCGKTYLSYPALYTHVKLKHQGIFPLGSSSKHSIEQNNNSDIQISFQSQKQFEIKYKRFHEYLQGNIQQGKRLITKEEFEDIVKPLNNKNYQYIDLFFDKIQTSLLYDNEKLLEHQLLQNINLDIGAIAGFYLRNLWIICREDLFFEYLLLMYALFLLDKHEELINGAQYLALVKKSKHNYVLRLWNQFLLEKFPLFINILKKEGFNLQYFNLDKEQLRNTVIAIELFYNFFFFKKVIQNEIHIKIKTVEYNQYYNLY